MEEKPVSQHCETLSFVSWQRAWPAHGIRTRGSITAALVEEGPQRLGTVCSLPGPPATITQVLARSSSPTTQGVITGWCQGGMQSSLRRHHALVQGGHVIPRAEMTQCGTHGHCSLCCSCYMLATPAAEKQCLPVAVTRTSLSWSVLSMSPLMKRLLLCFAQVSAELFGLCW